MTFTDRTRARRALTGVGAWMAVVSLTGCAHVKPEEMDAALSQVRADMRAELQQGDQQVAATLGSRMDGIDARLDALATDLEEMSQTFDVTVERMGNAIRFQSPVFFGFDEANVRDADRIVLDRFAEVIKNAYPGVLITAEGFTDPSGSAEYNRILGKRRADAVLDYLEVAGLSETQLRAVSYGEDTSRLIEGGGHGPGEAGLRNRRVVLVIEGAGAPLTTTTTDDTSGAL